MKYIGKILPLLLCAALCGCSQAWQSSEPPQQDVIQGWAAPSDSAGPADNAQSSPSATPDPRAARLHSVDLPSSTLRLSMRHPLNMNPLLNRDVTVDRALKLIFEPLFMLDATNKPVPNLVSGYSLSADGASVTVTLKPGLTWEDGQPVTTADLAYSIEALKNAASDAVYSACAAAISACAPTDAQTAVITFTSGGWDNLYALCFPIIPRHYYNPAGFASESSLPPLGGGPYKFDKWAGAKEIDFAASDNFTPAPLISAVKFIITPDDDTDYNAFAQNLTDALPATLSEWAKYGGAENIAAAEYTSQYYDFIGFNYTRPLFRNPDARRAVASVIDLSGAMSSVYLGHAARAYSPINPDSWLAVPDAAPPTYDPAAARRLFTQSGVDFNGSTARLKTGPPDSAYQNINLTILVNSENNERVKIAGMLKDDLAKLKIKSTVVSAPFEDYQSDINALKYDILVGGFDLSAVPDLSFAFGSAGGKTNIFGYADESMNACLANVTSAAGESAFKAAAADLQQYFYDSLPVVSIAFRNGALLTNPRVVLGDKPSLFYEFSDINLMKIK